MAVKLKQRTQRQVDTDSFSQKTNIATMINQSSEFSEKWNIKGNTKKIQLYKSLIKGSGSFFFEAKWSTAIDNLKHFLDYWVCTSGSQLLTTAKCFTMGFLHIYLSNPQVMHSKVASNFHQHSDKCFCISP